VGGEAAAPQVDRTDLFRRRRNRLYCVASVGRYGHLLGHGAFTLQRRPGKWASISAAGTAYHVVCPAASQSTEALT